MNFFGIEFLDGLMGEKTLFSSEDQGLMSDEQGLMLDYGEHRYGPVREDQQGSGTATVGNEYGMGVLWDQDGDGVIDHIKVVDYEGHYEAWKRCLVSDLSYNIPEGESQEDSSLGQEKGDNAPEKGYETHDFSYWTCIDWGKRGNN